MNVSGFTGWVYHLCDWIVRLAFLNTLWILFSFIGLGIFGWAPATAAMYTVLRQWFLYKREVPIFKTFFTAYKKDFIQTNIIGSLILLSCLSLYFTAATLVHLEQWAMMIISIILFIGIFLFSIVFLFSFPVFTHYKTSFSNYVRYSLMIGISHLHYSFLIVTALILTYILFGAMPGIMMFYAVSIPAALIMFLSLRVFHLIEEKSKNQHLSEKMKEENKQERHISLQL